MLQFFFFSSRRRHTRLQGDWSSDVCSSDLDQQTLCAYTVTGSPPQLKLVAARNFRYDRRLGNYNVGRPAPLEVKDLVERSEERRVGKEGRSRWSPDH